MSNTNVSESNMDRKVENGSDTSRKDVGESNTSRKVENGCDTVRNDLGKSDTVRNVVGKSDVVRKRKNGSISAGDELSNIGSSFIIIIMLYYIKNIIFFR